LLELLENRTLLGCDTEAARLADCPVDEPCATSAWVITNTNKSEAPEKAFLVICLLKFGCWLSLNATKQIRGPA
jgi:hypothetical protein